MPLYSRWVNSTLRLVISVPLALLLPLMPLLDFSLTTTNNFQQAGARVIPTKGSLEKLKYLA